MAPTLRRENTGSLFAFCHDCKLPEFLTRSRCQHHASVQPAELLVRLASGCRLGPGLPQESLIFLGPAVNQGTFFSWQKPGDLVLIKTWKEDKLHASWEGSYQVLQIIQTAMQTAKWR
ncbi:uncharacterized protein LOC144582171 isoform X4 [Callithrix jacchus]